MTTPSPHLPRPFPPGDVEVISDRRYSAAADVWAIGVIMYTLLTGSPPFHDHTDWATLRRSEAAVMPEEPLVRANVSPAARELLVELLRREPETRPTAVGALARFAWLKLGGGPGGKGGEGGGGGGDVASREPISIATHAAMTLLQKQRASQRLSVETGLLLHRLQTEGPIAAIGGHAGPADAANAAADDDDARGTTTAKAQGAARAGSAARIEEGDGEGGEGENAPGMPPTAPATALTALGQGLGPSIRMAIRNRLLELFCQLSPPDGALTLEQFGRLEKTFGADHLSLARAELFEVV